MRFDVTTNVIGYVTELMRCSTQEDDIAVFDKMDVIIFAEADAFSNHIC